VDREPHPASLYRRQPRRRADVELGGEVADTAERRLVSDLRAAAVVFNGVPESVDVLPVDFAAQQLGHRFGIVGWVPDGEVQVR
jgi:hypothetical protein